MISAEVVVRIQFYHLDPLRIVWYGNYPRFIEQARAALFDKISFGYSEMAESGFLWPVVDLRIKYVRPINPAHSIRVVATLLEYENRLKVRYLITDAETNELLTKAHSIQVTVDRTTKELCFETPQVLVDKIRRAL
jgi:acyl-CoA thioester hydrolase